MREELLTRMIRMYGFEHAAVIQFAQLMETEVSDETLRVIVESHEETGLAFEWEDEEEDF